MKDLLQIPFEKRDHEWERQFLTSFFAGKIHVKDPRPVNGPDGFPYLLVETTDEATEPTGKVVEWLAEKGIGMVVNPAREPHPDFVLSFGMLWGLKKFGGLWSQPFQVRETFQSGEPSEDVLPQAVRKIVKQFLIDQGVLQPRFLAVSGKQGLEFCFSLESLGNPPASEYEGIAEALSWFFPPQFTIALGSEKDLQKFVAV